MIVPGAPLGACLKRRGKGGRRPKPERNVVNPLTGQVTQEERPLEETEKWVRHFPDLRLIDDETFEAAQRRLQENSDKYAGSRNANGTLNGSSAGASPPRRLLSGLIKCGACGGNWHVGGAYGRSMFCTGHRRGICECKTRLRWDQAERMVLDVIGTRILKNPAWHRAVFEAALSAWQSQQRQSPDELKVAEAAVSQVVRKIRNLVDSIEDGSTDPDVKNRLAERRAEKQALDRKIQSLSRSGDEVAVEPTEAWIIEQLGQLADLLSDGGPAAAHALRDLVGGQIVVQQIQRPGRESYYLRGHLSIKCGALLKAALWNGEQANLVSELAASDRYEEFVIDFVDSDPKDELAETAKGYYDQGLLNKAIAKEMDMTGATSLACAGACPLNSNEVLSRYAQCKHGFTVSRLQRPDENERTWKEILVEDPSCTPAELAASRIDFDAWLRRLPRQKRRIATMLAAEESTSETAHKFQVTPGRISQLRREFAGNWHDFHGEPASAAGAVC